MRLIRSCLVAFVLLSANIMAWAAGSSTPPPAEVFFSSSGINFPALSPDGRHVAYRAVVQGKWMVVGLDLSTGHATGYTRADQLLSLHWKGNETLFCNDLGELKVINVVSRTVTPLRTLNKTFGIGIVADPLQFDRRRMLFAQLRKTMLYDFVSGTLEDLYTAREEGVWVSRYILDRNGVPRARYLHEGNDIRLQYRAAADKAFVTLKKWVLPAFPWVPLGLSADGPDRILVGSYDNKDLGELLYLDPKTGETTPAIDLPSSDALGGVIYSPDQTRILGVSVNASESTARWADPAMARLQQSLNASFPDKQVHFQTMSDDLQVLLFLVSSPKEPPTWYVLDRTKGSLQSLTRETPPLPLERMAETKAVEIKARDGLILHGFLTQPVNPGASPAPLILRIFDTPFGGRYYGGYDREAQYFASRGYATLKLNYRGVDGYGLAHFMAGRGEIAGRMIDDIHDAARWAVEQGVCRPGQICLQGRTLAGGMAIVAAAEQPDFFCGVICEDGVTSWRKFSDRWQYSVFASWFVVNNAAVFNRSPIAVIPKLNVPVLLVHAGPPNLSDEFERKLKSQKKAFSYADYYKGKPAPFAAAIIEAQSIESFLLKNLPPTR